MILAFQMDHKIISHISDPGAGNYGPITTMKLSEEYSRYTALKDAEMQRIESERSLLLSQHEAWRTLIVRAESQVNEFGAPKKGDKGDHIKKLQQLLIASGYLK